MQRSGVPVSVTPSTTTQDSLLYAIKQTLSRNYWQSPEGIFSFQFISGNSPLTNTIAPIAFQLIRYTPDSNYDAFETVIPGRLNNDFTFEYGSGRTGMLTSMGTIAWLGGGIWSPVSFVAPPGVDKLNLRQIRSQAYLDSKVLMDDIYNKKYLY